MLDEHSRLGLLALFALLQGVVWLAHRAGKRRHRPDAPALATEASSALLALLGLLLAFTVSMSVSRFEQRKALVIEEANAIGTAALRTQLLPAPFAEQSAALFREYVIGRLRWGEAARDASVEAELAAADARRHRALWAHAVAAGEVRPGPAHALYVSALNAVIDVQAARVHARMNRVPESVTFLLAGVALLALAVASAIAGGNGARRARDFHALALAIWLVIALIVDLDQPRRGWVRVSQDALRAAADGLDAPPH
jgi:hypothetical protein